ncbi:MAG: phosphomannomutase/phosphoglucomutase [Candidatus Nanoarchaeia archaeon]
MSIFKAYDIRGKYPSEINEEISGKIAKAFCQFLKPKTIVIGRDMRLSSESIKDELISSLISQGIKVINIGLVSTPMFYFAVNHFKADAGLMITASHNPKDYNGLKLVKEQAKPIHYDNGINEIEGLVQKNEFIESKLKGIEIKTDIEKDYLDYIKNLAPKKIKSFKIVADYGNGMNAVTTKKLLQSMNIELINMYDLIDGTFPNHEANPLKEETLVDLQKRVIAEKADLGLAFDGDGDRMVIIDEAGGIISGDMTTALISKEILNHSKEKILFDLRSSKAVTELIAKNGGTPLLTRVGHSFIKERMRNENICFAGELSGHFFFRENFFTDSADLAMLKVLSLLSKQEKNISELIKEIKKYYHSGEINKEVQNKDEIFERLKEKYGNLNFLTIDGLTFQDKDYWFNVRASNTEPLIRLTVEADTKEKMETKVKEVLSLIY